MPFLQQNSDYGEGNTQFLDTNNLDIADDLQEIPDQDVIITDTQQATFHEITRANLETTVDETDKLKQILILDIKFWKNQIVDFMTLESARAYYQPIKEKSNSLNLHVTRTVCENLFIDWKITDKRAS